MQYIEFDDFGSRMAPGRPFGKFDYSTLFGKRFYCACGDEHELKPWMEILREVPLFSFVVACPGGGHLTLLKVVDDDEMETAALISELGTRSFHGHQSRVGIRFQSSLLEAKTGRTWSLEETEAFMEHQQVLARRRRALC